MNTFSRTTIGMTWVFTLGIALAACTGGPPADTTKATIEEVAPAAAATDPAAAATASPAVYALSDDCYIGFAGYKIGGVHYGQFPAYTGTVSLTGSDLATMVIDLSIDMAKLSTDDATLTGTMLKENFFDVANHPKATFVSTGVTPGEKGVEVKGNLTLRGVTKGISFPAQVSIEGDSLTASAEFSVDRNAWSIGDGYIEAALLKDDVLIELDVTATKSAS